jgi:hypothetical protein
MSEAVVWPILGSEQEPGCDAPNTVLDEADIIPFPNSTELFFNKVTEQELVDYIGQTAKNLGIKIELGWSENFGIVYRCASFEDYDSFNDLLIAYEDSQEGAAAYHMASGAEIMVLTEIPEGEVIHIPTNNDQTDMETEFTQIKSDDLVYRLVSPQTYRAAITNQEFGISGELVTEYTDKINKYGFAGFIKDACDNDWHLQ